MLDPRQRRELTFVTLAASSREALLVLIEKYQNSESVARAFELAWTRAQLQFRFLGIGPAAAHRFQELASHLLYPNAALRPVGSKLNRNHLGQSGLWEYGISGDLPMLAVTVSDVRHLPLVRELLIAQTYWRWRGFRADLIILNQEGASYDLPLRQQLVRLIAARSSETGTDRPGGVFLRDWATIQEDRRNLFLSAAAVVLSGNRGSLQRQLVSAAERPEPPAFVATGGVEEVPSRPLPFLELPYFNGLGGFSQDGREYAIYMKPDDHTPAPWSNVMANRAFGTMVTESGLGCTWSGNSQMNRLTPWHNDPVSDPQSEAIYLRDEQSGAVWTPTPLPIRENDAYRTRHGQGYTVYEHNSHAIGQELTIFVPLGQDGAGDPVKICRLRLRNDSGRQRRLTVAYFAEWVLGSVREDQQVHVRTAFDEASGAILASQYWNGSAAGQPAFAAAIPRASSYTGNRTSFLGRNNPASRPAAMDRMCLDNCTGAEFDPAAALQVSAVIEADHVMEVIFLLGQSTNVEAVREIVGRYSNPGQVEDALAATRQWWEARLGALQVRTPVLSVDLLVNRWLLYQTLSCRFWARAALYQSSGAFGFRDQLQDSMALIYSAPELTRAHLLTAATRQFTEGDVQHWWHSETGMGVRTRCSDDLLWLPFVVAHYVKVTRDTAILDAEVPFLDGPVLEAEHQERMFIPGESAETAPLWEHCRRAIDKAWQLGSHKLPLFGNGDWNDGMNRVGENGKGESIWLGWFVFDVLTKFIPVAEARADGKRAATWLLHTTVLKDSLEDNGWDGDWYRRAYYDDGTPLGSVANAECRIDSIAQSWSVLSGAAEPARAARAMQALDKYLVRGSDQLMLLFTPPFVTTEHDPGYIKGYPAGLRENGGQYTHGVLWAVAAFAELGLGSRAGELFAMLNPINHSRSRTAAQRYRVEPYVVCGDVYSVTPHVGRGGWTWYSGSAGWMYRVGIEWILGLRLKGDALAIDPCIPAHWPRFDAKLRHKGTIFEIAVENPHGLSKGVAELTLDGVPIDAATVALPADRATHKIRAVLGEKKIVIPEQSADAAQ
jgi:cyclic beta-1,2-glucan synthetase